MSTQLNGRDLPITGQEHPSYLDQPSTTYATYSSLQVYNSASVSTSRSPSLAENISSAQHQTTDEDANPGDVLVGPYNTPGKGLVKPYNTPGKGRGATGKPKGRPPGSPNKPKTPKKPKGKIGKPKGSKNRYPKGTPMAPPPPEYEKRAPPTAAAQKAKTEPKRRRQQKRTERTLATPPSTPTDARATVFAKKLNACNSTLTNPEDLMTPMVTSYPPATTSAFANEYPSRLGFSTVPEASNAFGNDNSTNPFVPSRPYLRPNIPNRRPTQAPNNEPWSLFCNFPASATPQASHASTGFDNSRPMPQPCQSIASQFASGAQHNPPASASLPPSAFASTSWTQPNYTLDDTNASQAATGAHDNPLAQSALQPGAFGDATLTDAADSYEDLASMDFFDWEGPK